MNKISFAGRLGSDSEIKFLSNGDAICNFTVASDIGYGDKKSTNWFRCAIFGKRAEALEQYLKKGQQVTVFGSLTLREWENKDGVKQISPDVRVDEISLQGGKQQSEGAAPSPAPRQQTSQAPAQRRAPMLDDLEDDAIPF